MGWAVWSKVPAELWLTVEPYASTEQVQYDKSKQGLEAGELR